MALVKRSLCIAIVLLVLSCQSTTTVLIDDTSRASGTSVAARSLSEARFESQKNVENPEPRGVSPDTGRGNPKLDPRRQLGGLVVERDPAQGYSLIWPQHWQRYPMKDLTGTIYAPGNDLQTGFYLFIDDVSGKLEGPVTAAYVADRQKEVLTQVDDLPNGEILHQGGITNGSAIGFEILYTFRRESETCKRLMRVLYKDQTRYTIYEQGASPYEYDVFYDTFEFMYSSFTLGDILASPGLHSAD